MYIFSDNGTIKPLAEVRFFSVRSGPFGLGIPLFSRRRRATVFCPGSARRSRPARDLSGDRRSAYFLVVILASTAASAPILALSAVYMTDLPLCVLLTRPPNFSRPT